MRSDDEEENENDYEDEDEEDEDEVMRDAPEDEENEEEENEAEDGEGLDEDGDDDAEGDDDDDEDDEGEGDGDDDEEDDDDEDDQDEDDEGSDDDEGGDEDMEVDGEEGTSGQSQHSPARSKLSPSSQLPAHLKRRALFVPGYTQTPVSLSIEAIVGIPLPAPTHAVASTACMSYLLTGSQDGYVRAYDFWGSVSGAQAMTSQQRSVVGLGEGVSKAGVARGWWANEVDVLEGATVVAKRAEPVYSMACEGDGLWTLTGTRSGVINLFTLRHAPGRHIHSLKGHTNVVSCLSLLPDEKGLVSGSWDGSIREWDLNTGQTVRTYPSHGAQVSSLSLRPAHAPASPTPAIAVSVGPDFFDKSDPHSAPRSTSQAEETAPATLPSADATDAAPPDPTPAAENAAPAKDVDMASVKSPESYDPLFDDDAEGETAPATVATTPAPIANGHSLSLPGQFNKAKPNLTIAFPEQPKSGAVNLPQPPSSASTTASHLFNSNAPASRAAAAATIPLLSPTTYRAFSDDIVLAASMDGQVTLIDRRVPSGSASSGVGRLLPGEKAPPWCMSACWSGNGQQILAGRRNGTVDVWDVRKSSSSSSPSLLRTLRTPAESGPVSCVVAFPDGRHIATASQDNVRLWNTAELYEPEDMKRSRSRPPFKIIAGHHGGIVSSMLVDATSRFLVTASGDRGWQGESTKVVLIHEIKW